MLPWYLCAEAGSGYPLVVLLGEIVGMGIVSTWELQRLFPLQIRLIVDSALVLAAPRRADGYLSALL